MSDVDRSGKEISRIYALGFCVLGGNPQTYYLTQNPEQLESSDKLLISCIDDMLKPKFDNFIFYVHNLGRYDAVYIQKILHDFNTKVRAKYVITPFYRDNQVLRLTIKVNLTKNKSVKIHFVDSLNLLNSSLDTLCKDYGITQPKTVFPYKFVNKNNLNYVGPTPDISYYNRSIDVNKYNDLSSDNWSTQNETILYLNRDLVALLSVLEIFQDHLWLDHNLEMTHSLTISSLAKTKFLRFYLKDSKIPLINNQFMFNFIYDALYGGITEVYRPYGTKLTYLDVNSFYLLRLALYNNLNRDFHKSIDQD